MALAGRNGGCYSDQRMWFIHQEADVSRLLRSTLFILVSVLLAAPVAAQQPALMTPYEFLTRSDPVSLIGAYYNAISRSEYDRAYSYWEQAPGNQTAAQFAAGFADTASVRALVYLPIVTDAGAGNVHAQLPTLVIADRHDGTQAYFAGCFTAHKTNVPVGNATAPDPNWYLQQGRLTQQQAPDLTVLDAVCQQTDTLQSGASVMGQFDPSQLLTSYFTLVATGGIGQGAPYWQTPYGDMYAALYGQRAANASRLRLFVNPEVDAQGAAGSVYGNVSALVMATGADNLVRYVGGCYTVRQSNVPVGNATTPDPNWYFNNLTLTLTLDIYPAVKTTAEGCAP